MIWRGEAERLHKVADRVEAAAHGGGDRDSPEALQNQVTLLSAALEAANRFTSIEIEVPPDQEYERARDQAKRLVRAALRLVGREPLD